MGPEQDAEQTVALNGCQMMKPTKIYRRGEKNACYYLFNVAWSGSGIWSTLLVQLPGKKLGHDS